MSYLKYIFLLFALLSCQKEKGFFLGYSAAEKNKFYTTVSSPPDTSRPLYILCSNDTTEVALSDFKIMPFDSIDYYSLDMPRNRDLAPKFTVVTDKYLENCSYPLAIQVDAEIDLYSVKKISAEQISKNSALNWLTPICIKDDHGFEYKFQSTNQNHIYTVYHLFHYIECQVFTEHFVLMKGEHTLIKIQI